MGMIINIDAALSNRAEYNVLREPINMLKAKQEESNPRPIVQTRYNQQISRDLYRQYWFRACFRRN